jgi:hypothetical protein
MEIERIQPVHGLKVERTGSESERRRHQRPDEEFNELLEQSLSDDSHKGQQEKAHDDHDIYSTNANPVQEVLAYLPHDTVSLSTTTPLQPTAAPDIVSISASARVSAESLNASNTALHLSLVQRAVQGLRNIAAPATTPPAAQPVAAATHSPEVPPPAGSVDTLA